jgi:hypothetical protein
VSVPEATLGRGYAYGLPSGESVASAIGADVLGPEVIEAGFGPPGSPGAYPPVLVGKTPLWYYVLREAQHHGGRLGDVGSRIAVETVHGLLHADASSFVHDAGWKPTLGSVQGQFGVLDLLGVAGIPGFVQP